MDQTEYITETTPNTTGENKKWISNAKACMHAVNGYFRCKCYVICACLLIRIWLRHCWRGTRHWVNPSSFLPLFFFVRQILHLYTTRTLWRLQRLAASDDQGRGRLPHHRLERHQRANQKKHNSGLSPWDEGALGCTSMARSWINRDEAFVSSWVHILMFIIKTPMALRWRVREGRVSSLSRCHSRSILPVPSWVKNYFAQRNDFHDRTDAQCNFAFFAFSITSESGTFHWSLN